MPLYAALYPSPTHTHARPHTQPQRTTFAVRARWRDTLTPPPLSRPVLPTAEKGFVSDLIYHLFTDLIARQLRAAQKRYLATLFHSTHRNTDSNKAAERRGKCRTECVCVWERGECECEYECECDCESVCWFWLDIVCAEKSFWFRFACNSFRVCSSNKFRRFFSRLHFVYFIVNLLPLPLLLLPFLVAR